MVFIFYDFCGIIYIYLLIYYVHILNNIYNHAWRL